MALLNISKHQGIAIVSLNRPEKRNAISFAMLHELIKTANQLKKDRTVRCVVLTGESQVFSSGIDLKDLNHPKNLGYAAWQLVKPGQSIFQHAFLIWKELPVPVIAAVEGFCFGAGMQLALAADIRIAHPQTQLSIMESRWGLVPDMGLSESLKGILRLDLAKELTLTARVFDAEYAQQIGLVTHLDEQPLDQALRLAYEIVQRSPDAILAGKRVLDAMIYQPQRALRLEKIWQLKLLIGKNSRLARKKDKDPAVQFGTRQFH